MVTISTVKLIWYPQRVQRGFVDWSVPPVSGPNEQAALLEALEVDVRTAVADRHPGCEAPFGDRAVN